MKYGISDLACMKGISEPVRQALYEMEEEISKKNKRIAELGQRIAELEKDCEILQTNLDDALMRCKKFEGKS